MSSPSEALHASTPRAASPFLARLRHPQFLILATALIVSFAAFGHTLHDYFLGDDFGYVGKFHSFPLAQWPRLFVNDWSEGFWGFQLRELRPVTGLTLMLDARIWGIDPFGYRLTNLLLHATSATLVGLIAWRVSGRTLLCGLAAAVFFALHPAHAEPVLWITGRVDAGTTMWYLLGFAAFLGYRDHGRTGWLVTIWLAYFLAAFSKEFGLTMPLMLIAADVFWQQSWRRWRSWSTWAPYIGCVAIVIGYYFCRRAAFTAGGVGAGLPDLASAEFHTQFSQRQLTYIAHLFPPMQQWFRDGKPAYAQFAVHTFLISAGVAAALAIAWRWLPGRRSIEERRAGLFFGLGWYLIATLPLVITYVSGRHLYLASAGVCIAFALILHSLLRMRVVFIAAALALSGLYGYRLAYTASPWHDAGILSRDAVHALAQVDRESEKGGALLIDVPEMVRGAYHWTWAIPFGVRPPFVPARLDEQRLAVFESPGIYYDWGIWHTQPAVAALQKVDKTCWVIQANDDRTVRLLKVTPEKMRVAAEHFAASPTQPSPHAAWRKLVSEAIAP